MIHIEGRKVAEIAQELNIDKATVEKIYYAARRLYGKSNRNRKVVLAATPEEKQAPRPAPRYSNSGYLSAIEKYGD